MSILYLHGVNVRQTDPAYFVGVGLRRTLFQQVVVPVGHQAGHAGFGVLEPIYWGDLGARFRWDLRSVPSSSIESLGHESAIDPLHYPLLHLLTDVAPPSVVSSARPDLDLLGTDESEPLAAAAQVDPRRFIRAVLAPSVSALSPTPGHGLASSPATVGTPGESVAEGERLAHLLLAGDAVSRELEAQRELRMATTDLDALGIVSRRVEAEYRRLVANHASPGIDVLGPDPLRWVRNRLRDVTEAAQSAVRKLREVVTRGPSLLLLTAIRSRMTRPALLFFGDVFVYLHEGRPAAKGTISDKVVRAVCAAAEDPARSGPLVVVSHSFGSMILYDLLTSGRLNNVMIDLWVTVGSQVSIFAELGLFESISDDVPSEARPHLGRPRNVSRWVNVYDAADSLSYLFEPVFGADAVHDRELQEGAHLFNAHGDYLTEPEFYRIIAAELEVSLAAKSQDP